MQTCDNNRFLRLWHEVNICKACLHNAKLESTTDFGYKWIPYNKGGDFRKWYGNQEYVLNWLNDGQEAKEYAISLYRCVTRTIKSIQYFFRDTISWSKISSGTVSFRYYPQGFIFDVAGCCIYSDNLPIVSIMAFLNSSVAKLYLSMLSPTLNYEAGHIGSIPIVAEAFNPDVSKYATPMNWTISLNRFMASPGVFLTSSNTLSPIHTIGCMKRKRFLIRGRKLRET